MARFFIDRPIVAMVISILMVIIGLVAMAQLPIAQYPNIAPPEMLLTANYPGADAVTLEQSVATPLEQQMSGMDNMLYMNSTSQTSGNEMNLRVSFDITTDPNIEQVLVNMRYSQASSQLPQDVVNQGVTVKKSVLSPLALFILHSPKGTYDELFLSNYAYVNLNDPMTRVPGIGQVTVFVANKYAIRFCVNPDTLAKLDITVNEIVRALQAQNTVNPAGQLGGKPVPRGQEFTYTVLAQGRLASVEDFENVVVRATPDGSIVRVRDVARVELGEQSYYRDARLNGRPAAGIAIYQLPGSNAVETMKAATKLMEEAKARFPDDRLRDGVRHDPGGDGRHPGDRKDAGRGAHPGRHRRVHLPPGLPGDPDPAAGGAGLDGRHVHGLPAPGLLDQHALALRPGAGHRTGRGRRHRSGRGRRAPHRARVVAARRGLHGDAAGLGPGRRDRPGPGRRLRADGVRPWHHRADVPTVRDHHRRLGRHLGLQRAHAEPRALGIAPAAQARDARPARMVLPWLQPRLRTGDGRVSRRESDPDPQGRLRDTPAARRGGRFGPHRHPASGWFRPGGGPGILLRQRAAPTRRLPRAHGGRRSEERRVGKECPSL